MKKGLGSIPKGLAWIDQEELDQKEPQAQPEPRYKKIHAEKNSSQEGLPSGWTRATFIIKQEHCAKLKALAYWERLTVKEIVNKILDDFLQDKKIRSIPKKQPE